MLVQAVNSPLVAASCWQRLWGGNVGGAGGGGLGESCKLLSVSLQILPACTMYGHLLPVDTRTADEGASTDGGPASAPDRQQQLEVVPAAQLLRLRTLAEAMLRSGDQTCFKVS